MNQKRKRNIADVDTELVEIFDNLASNDSSTRSGAAVALLTKVSPNNGADAAFRQKILRRLIRGLSSGRKSARIGFAVVLIEFLSTYAQRPNAEENVSLSLRQIINELESATHVNDDLAGQEVRDHYLGKLFGAAAFIRSGVLFSDPSDIGEWERILEFVFRIHKKKPWLRQQCGWTLYCSLEALHRVADGHVYVSRLMERLVANGQVKSPEGIAIWVATRRRFPSIQMPDNVFHHKDPLSREERVAIARLLRESTREITQDEAGEPAQPNQVSSGFWNPTLNFAWQVVFDELAHRAEDEGSISFAELWEEAVEEGLFSIKSSHERRYWGLQLFQHFIQHGSVEHLLAIFGPNLMSCLLNHASIEDRLLNAVATQSIELMQKRAAESKTTVPLMVTAMLEVNVGPNPAARTRIIERLLAEADLEGLEVLVAELGSILEVKSSERGQAGRLDSLNLADCLVSIIRSHDFPREEPDQERFRTVMNSTLDALVHAAFSDTTGESTNGAASRARIMTCLNHIIVKDVSDPAYHPYHTLQSIRSSGFKFDADDAVLKAVAHGHKSLDSIVQKSSKADKKDVLQAFKLLFTFAILQAYYGEADAVNVIDELQASYKSLQKKNHQEDGDSSVVAIVEVIIDFVSKQSALYRRLAPKMLAPITDRIPEEGLDTLLDVLETKEDVQGQGELFSTQAEEDLDVEMAERMNDVSDVEEVTDDTGSSDNSDSGSDAVADSRSSLEGSDAEAEAEAEAAELAEFDEKLAKALGTRRGDDDVAVDESESSDTDMDDQQMEGLDAQLSNMFKLRKGKTNARTDKKRARDTIVNFKTKVLELLEVYVKQEHRNPRALHIVAPLLSSMHATSSNQISQKICELVRQFSKLYKVKKDESDTKEGGMTERLKLLRDVHTMLGRSTSHLQAKACSSASLLVVKAMLSSGANIETAREAYAETTKDLKMDKDYKFRQCFVEDWRNWQAQAQQTGLIPKSTGKI